MNTTRGTVRLAASVMLWVCVATGTLSTSVTAATLELDLQDAQLSVDNNIARFTVQGKFTATPGQPDDLVQSVQIGLNTNGNVSAFSFKPDLVFLQNPPFFGDFDPSDAPNDVNAFMQIDDQFNDGLPDGFDGPIGVIEVNLRQAGIAVGDPLLVDISRVDNFTGTSGTFANNTLPPPDNAGELIITFLDIGIIGDPTDDGKRTLLVPQPTNIPEPAALTLLICATATCLRRRSKESAPACSHGDQVRR